MPDAGDPADDGEFPRLFMVIIKGCFYLSSGRRPKTEENNVKCKRRVMNGKGEMRMERIRWFFGVRWHMVIWWLACLAVYRVRRLVLDIRLRCLGAYIKYAEAHLSGE